MLELLNKSLEDALKNSPDNEKAIRANHMASVRAVENYYLESRPMAAEILKRKIKRKFSGTLFCEPMDKIRLKIDGTMFVTELRNLAGVYRIPVNHVFIFDTTRHLESGLLMRVRNFVAKTTDQKNRITELAKHLDAGTDTFSNMINRITDASSTK